MATTYVYSIVGDFSAGIEPSQLQDAIVASAIATAITRIDTIADVVNIIFPSALSGGDQTLLDGLVAAHVPVIIDTSEVQAAFIYSTGTTNVFNETANYDIPLNVESILTSGITHATNSAEIQIAVAGIYRISYKLTTQSTNFASDGRVWLSLKPVAGSFTTITGTEGHFSSTDPSQVTITGTVIVNITENDIIKLSARGIAADDDFILVADDSNVYIQQIV